MKRKLPIIVLLVLVFAVFVMTIAGGSTVSAQGGYEIKSWTVDSGGGTSKLSGGEYVLEGTIGQPDEGELEGGEYALHSGFWVRGFLTAIEYLVNLPLVLR